MEIGIIAFVGFLFIMAICDGLDRIHTQNWLDNETKGLNAKLQKQKNKNRRVRHGKRG